MNYFLKTLLTLGNREIGRYLFIPILFPVLCNGVTTAFFGLTWKIDSVIDLLMKYVKKRRQKVLG